MSPTKMLQGAALAIVLITSAAVRAAEATPLTSLRASVHRAALAGAPLLTQSPQTTKPHSRNVGKWALAGAAAGTAVGLALGMIASDVGGSERPAVVGVYFVIPGAVIGGVVGYVAAKIR